MVYYIRFLKTPRAQGLKPGLVSVSALISITTDLGDAFLAEDVELLAQLIDTGGNGKKPATLQELPYKWEAGKRELAISTGRIRVPSKNSQLVLTVGPKTTTLHINLNGPSVVPLVISGWSAPFDASQNVPAEKLIERRFVLQNNVQLKVWEETGNNIARHIWDAALAAIMCLQDAIGCSDSCSMKQLRSRFNRERYKPIRVIELGSGCGVVGLALAQMLPRCSVTLTDLAEVNDIVARNLQVGNLAPESTCDFRELDWDEELDGEMLQQPIDLILVSDCTYNADSLPSLVRVVDRLTQVSPEALALVSLKRRHESEEVFFDLMRQSGFAITEQCICPLPAAYLDEDQIEIYGFGRHKKS